MKNTKNCKNTTKTNCGSTTKKSNKKTTGQKTVGNHEEEDD